MNTIAIGTLVFIVPEREFGTIQSVRQHPYDGENIYRIKGILVGEFGEDELIIPDYGAFKLGQTVCLKAQPGNIGQVSGFDRDGRVLVEFGGLELSYKHDELAGCP